MISDAYCILYSVLLPKETMVVSLGNKTMKKGTTHLLEFSIQICMGTSGAIGLIVSVKLNTNCSFKASTTWLL
jgi:hypothetical protein